MIPLGVFGGCHSINSEVESAAIIVTLFGTSDGAIYKILLLFINIQQFILPSSKVVMLIQLSGPLSPIQ